MQISLNNERYRYGTMSSLEKVSSEETDDKTLNSSDEDYDCDDGELQCSILSLLSITVFPSFVMQFNSSECY